MGLLDLPFLIPTQLLLGVSILCCLFGIYLFWSIVSNDITFSSVVFKGIGVALLLLCAYGSYFAYVTKSELDLLMNEYNGVASSMSMNSGMGMQPQYQQMNNYQPMPPQYQQMPQPMPPMPPMPPQYQQMPQQMPQQMSQPMPPPQQYQPQQYQPQPPQMQPQPPQMQPMPQQMPPQQYQQI